MTFTKDDLETLVAIKESWASSEDVAPRWDTKCLLLAYESKQYYPFSALEPSELSQQLEEAKNWLFFFPTYPKPPLP